MLMSVGGALVVAAGAISAGARINSTASYPVGLYWTVERNPAVGELVMFCPPERDAIEEAKRRDYVGAGFCPGGYGFLIKKIVAESNDVIDIKDDGVVVNGSAIPNSRPAPVDSAGRPLPQLRLEAYTVGPTEILLLSDRSVRSFDGRYFGVIDKTHIRSVIDPVFTW